jgi:hypothetical protein
MMCKKCLRIMCLDRFFGRDIKNGTSETLALAGDVYDVQKVLANYVLG